MIPENVTNWFTIMKKILAIVLFLSASAAAQTETLTNAKVTEMVRAGLGVKLIVGKIKAVDADFDVSADGMIALKKDGVSDEIVEAMSSKPHTAVASVPNKSVPFAAPATNVESASTRPNTPSEILASAKTIAFVKSSLNPSRQALEKELLKRKDWQSLHLTIDRYKDSAGLYVEIGFVTASIITHRYVYRIYDRRSGTVIAAGETTSWGSLPENLARHISASLQKIYSGT